MPTECDDADWLNAALTIVTSSESIEAAILKLRDFIQVDHLVYHSSRRGSNPSMEPYIRLTYPASWVKQYLQMGYVDIDPVLKQGFLRTVPFMWSELSISTAKEAAMLGDALKHGVGPHGFSIPVRDKRGHQGLFSMSFSGDLDSWDRFVSCRTMHLVEVANSIHGRAIREEFGETRYQLSNRELECLFWVGEGKDADEIATILKISVHTARGYLKSARFKLDCVTSTQAVGKALKLGLFPPSVNQNTKKR